MVAYITVLNYVYSLCVFNYSVLSCVADVADCLLQRLSSIVIKNIIIIIIIIVIICINECLKNAGFEKSNRILLATLTQVNIGK